MNYDYDRTTRFAFRLLALTARALARGCDAIGRLDAGDDLRYFADYGGGRYRAGAVFNSPERVEFVRRRPVGVAS